MELTQSGLLVPTGIVEHVDLGAKAALDRQFEGMRKLEHFFPKLVELTKDLANRLTKMAKEKQLGPEAVMLDAPRWRNTGHVMVRMGLDDLAEKKPLEENTKTYFTLRAIGEDMPALVDMAMAIAFQLVPVINHRKMLPAEISFTKPSFAIDNKAFVFRVMFKEKGMAMPSQVQI